MEFAPKPIDTSSIILPAELDDLIETLAENTHDVWAAQRIAQGWTYGEKKDDEKKTTPLLVPYHELPEVEKDYDRSTAMETLRLVVKLGFDVVKK